MTSYFLKSKIGKMQTEVQRLNKLLNKAIAEESHRITKSPLQKSLRKRIRALKSEIEEKAQMYELLSNKQTVENFKLK
jgi:predicted RNase H-like nuclease (RuvC/YqgF family)